MGRASAGFALVSPAARRQVRANVKRTVSPVHWLGPLLALVLPPFLLVPLVKRLPSAQLFKDCYEASLWITPGVGLIVLVMIFRRRRHEPDLLRRGPIVAGLLFAALDLIAPVLFYVLLALLAGR
jgi:hypothetical protein